MKILHVTARRHLSGAHLTAALAAVVLVSVPAAAVAQVRDVRNYDGYCYAKQKDAQSSGTVVGAIIGGLVGSQVSKNERGLGAVVGAVIGGSVGNSAGKNSVKCYNGDYYAYQGRYYDPAPPPRGYATVFYRDRPNQDRYSHVYYDRYHRQTPPPYSYNDAWRNDDDRNPYGWRDDRGDWHEGRKANNTKPHGHDRGRRGHD